MEVINQWNFSFEKIVIDLLKQFENYHEMYETKSVSQI